MSETQNQNLGDAGQSLPNAGVNALENVGNLKELVSGTLVAGERAMFVLCSLTDAEEVEDEDEKEEHSSFPYISSRKLYKQFWVIDVDDSYDKDNIREDVYDRLFDYYFEHNFRLEDLDFRSDDIVAYITQKGE